MKKSDLVNAVAEKTGLTKKDVEAVVSSTLDVIVEAVANGEKVQFTGFGTFEQRVRSARVGCNPSTHEKIEIPESKAPAFKAGQLFKTAVNK